MQYRTYEKTAEEVAKINAEYAPDGDPEVHFDSTGERRHMGAAHIRLGTGDARKQKMAELGQLHEETLRGRAEHGAVGLCRRGPMALLRGPEVLRWGKRGNVWLRGFAQCCCQKRS